MAFHQDLSGKMVVQVDTLLKPNVVFCRDEFKTLVNLLKSSSSKPAESGVTGLHSISNVLTIDEPLNARDCGACVGNSTCNSVQKNSDVWLVDSGASDHICCSLNWYIDYHNIEPITISLPSGHTFKVTIVGRRVKLGSNLILKNVFYVPIFALNLIVVSKLMQHDNYSVHFIDNGCFIQDQKNRKIGGARLIHGVFFLDHFETSGTSIEGVVNLTASCNNVVSIPNSALWHFRLGHAPMALVQKLKAQLPYVDCEEVGVCDICHFLQNRKEQVSLLASVMHLECLPCCIWIFGALTLLRQYMDISIFLL